jgi:hypothetical protein
MSVQRLCLFFTHILSVIEMEYTQKHQPILRVELSTQIEIKKPSAPKRADIYDKTSAEFRTKEISQCSSRSQNVIHAIDWIGEIESCLRILLIVA